MMCLDFQGSGADRAPWDCVNLDMLMRKGLSTSTDSGERMKHYTVYTLRSTPHIAAE